MTLVRLHSVPSESEDIHTKMDGLPLTRSILPSLRRCLERQQQAAHELQDEKQQTMGIETTNAAHSDGSTAKTPAVCLGVAQVKPAFVLSVRAKLDPSWNAEAGVGWQREKYVKCLPAVPGLAVSCVSPNRGYMQPAGRGMVVRGSQVVPPSVDAKSSLRPPPADALVQQGSGSLILQCKGQSVSTRRNVSCSPTVTATMLIIEDAAGTIESPESAGSLNVCVLLSLEACSVSFFTVKRVVAKVAAVPVELTTASRHRIEPSADAMPARPQNSGPAGTSHCFSQPLPSTDKNTAAEGRGGLKQQLSSRSVTCTMSSPPTAAAEFGNQKC